MAPIEPDLYNANFRPISLFSGYIVLASSLTYLITRRVLYRAYTSIPPSQATRHRQHDRQRHVRIFAGLTVLSLGVACYQLFSLLSLSYKVWAHERGEALPIGLWGRGGLFGGDEGQGLALGRWFHDTDLLRETWEIAIEKSRRFWWTQQLWLGAAAWSVFLGIEGQRRNIPYLWAFMTLALTVSLSFTQNLFFLALLWTPLPLSDDTASPPLLKKVRIAPKTPSVRKVTKVVHNAAAKTEGLIIRTRNQLSSYATYHLPSKPSDWTPYPIVHILLLLPTVILIFLLPFASSTPSFPTIIILTHFALVPPLYPHLLPTAFGSTHSSSLSTHHSYLPLFRFVALTVFLLHLKQTSIALLDNEPGSHYHRHSLMFFYQDEERSKLERTASAASRVLAAMNDHPSVSKVAWDVILCGASCILWAAVRGLDAEAMLENVGWMGGNAVSLLKAMPEATASGAKGKNKESFKIPQITRKTLSNSRDDSSEEEAFAPDGGVGKAHGRDGASDMSTEIGGEEDVAEDWEAGALAWGLTAVGGLGIGSVGVMGGEVGGR